MIKKFCEMVHLGNIEKNHFAGLYKVMPVGFGPLKFVIKSSIRLINRK